MMNQALSLPDIYPSVSPHSVFNEIAFCGYPSL